jgi:hypothetical protein
MYDTFLRVQILVPIQQSINNIPSVIKMKKSCPKPLTRLDLFIYRLAFLIVRFAHGRAPPAV